jgi:hypothetical protein
MRRPSPPQPVIAFGPDDLGERPDRAVAAGRARRVARGVYTTDLERPLDQVVRAHLFEIVGRLVPDGVITDRSGGPAVIVDDTLFIASPSRRRDLALPGLRVAVRPGLGALEDDPPWPGGLHRASVARALVENLAPSRARKGPARTLTDGELADWVAVLALQHGADRLNRIRDRARALAPRFGQSDRFGFLDDLIGAALGTRQAPATGALLRARTRRRDWDVRRMALFEKLADTLCQPLAGEVPGTLPVLLPARDRERPFFEAYFSNFIEGTEFELDEAVRIIYERAVPAERPADAHDVLHTYELIVDPEEADATPPSAEAFLDQLRRRHARLMASRPAMRPGVFKSIPNRVGSYTFVSPELVEGTLERGLGLRAQCPTAFTRAIFMMFLVSEVHPFDDGNGRVARLAMNAELSAAGEQRILVPIVSRNDYLGGLRRLSIDGDPNLLIRVLGRLWRWSAAVDFSDLAVARAEVEASHALVDPLEAERAGLHLSDPRSRP